VGRTLRVALSLVVVPSAVAAVALPVGAAQALPQPVSLVAPAREFEPVVLTGSQFPDWSMGPELTARAPQPPTDYGVADIQGRLPQQLRSDCYTASPTPDPNGYVDDNHNDHSCYQSSQLPVRTTPGRKGVAPSTLLGYRWNAHANRFVQIPFQVDTKWIHYLSNNASGFAFYSGVDQVTTYTFDREGWRYTANPPFDPNNPAVVCEARPVNGVSTTPDPNAGLIDSDELVFMARDAGPAAPATATLPQNIAEARQVRVVDPITRAVSYVYVMRSAQDAHGAPLVQPAFTAATSPYVRYQRDANADTYVYSQSSYGNYGNAPKGPVCTPDGQPVIGRGFKLDGSGHLVLDPSTFVQRRPVDNATVTTPRYRFRYDGRWVMDDLQVSPDDNGLGSGDYGPNIIDRWKARAFQQSPGGNTPCCGYEEEATNWGGSTILMGEKVGPVRDIRVTWGADSSTNNVRTEVFYPEMVSYQDELRVHPIPPFDGIYVQRDMAAGRTTRYYNNYIPDGVPVDGINDEAFGNLHAHVGPDGVSLDSADTFGQTLHQVNGGPLVIGSPDDNGSACDAAGNACLHGDFDVTDVSFSGPPGTLQWEELAGPTGSVVERWNIHQVTPLGTPLAALAAYPYYRDDSCFDDGTGTDPGPKLHLRSKDEPTTWGYDPVTGVPMSPAPAGASPVYQRRCWNHHPDGSPYNLPGTLTYDSSKPADTPDAPPDPGFSPQGDIRYFQGDVGTHGLHLEFVTDSDNADLTVPVDEIDTEQREVVLRGDPGNVGEKYGHSFDKPLVAVVLPGGVGTPSGAASGKGAGNGRGAAPAGDAATAAARDQGSTASARPATSAGRTGALSVTPVAAALGAAAGSSALAAWLLPVALRRRRTPRSPRSS
jgi:hypothetical protein